MDYTFYDPFLYFDGDYNNRRYDYRRQPLSLHPFFRPWYVQYIDEEDSRAQRHQKQGGDRRRPYLLNQQRQDNNQAKAVSEPKSTMSVNTTVPGAHSISIQTPGFMPKDIELDLCTSPDGYPYLEIKGKKTEKRQEGNNYCMYKSSFSRSIPLSEGVKQDMIDAEMNNGVLTVTIKCPPEKPPVQKQSISIKSSGKSDSSTCSQCQDAEMGEEDHQSQPQEVGESSGVQIPIGTNNKNGNSKEKGGKTQVTVTPADDQA